MSDATLDSTLVIQQQTAGVVVLTLNRPQALNALNLAILQRLAALFEELRDDPTVRAVIVTGSGRRAFCAGADIGYLNAASPLAVRDFARLAVEVNHRIETLGKPVIAAINGVALGGGLELAESCLLRVAVRTAQLGHPEVKIGAVAGFGGTTRLPRLVGRGRAAEMLLRGRAVDADEGRQIGLVQSVVDPDRLLDEAQAIVADILAQSPIAVRLTWEAMHRGLNLSLEEAAQLGADAFGLVAASDDFRIGTAAFLGKRQALWSGR
ncbi:enoyl-CoA hydratase-related protein [Accumulibacter sp.]|uniref:enoyl-CoA hydratase/isomerase family protein n=1 Tax=Accumulibacter sp. TaxID=2053492 RepID=UPI002604D278|nr:enoyl-CoA hydratase-related protein [Accumulibacter sp.]